MQENIPLAPLTTLRVGGAARYLAKIASREDLLQAVDFAHDEELPIFVLGAGSNVLVGDKGFHGVVLQMAMADPPVTFEESAESVTCRVPAGADWDAFVLDVCGRGLVGVECLAGIPGLVGGTPVQNVGAYGQEVAETIVALRALDVEGMSFVSLSAAECGFGYRRSIFNTSARGRYIVTRVTFRFERSRRVELKYAELREHFAGRQPSPMEVYHAVREIRHRKGMLLVEGEADCRSAGSFFKNPVVADTVFAAMAKEFGEVTALGRGRGQGEARRSVAAGEGWISQGVCDGAGWDLVEAYAGGGQSRRGNSGGDCGAARCDSGESAGAVWDQAGAGAREAGVRGLSSFA